MRATRSRIGLSIFGAGMVFLSALLLFGGQIFALKAAEASARKDSNGVLVTAPAPGEGSSKKDLVRIFTLDQPSPGRLRLLDHAFVLLSPGHEVKGTTRPVTDIAPIDFGSNSTTREEGRSRSEARRRLGEFSVSRTRRAKRPSLSHPPARPAPPTPPRRSALGRPSPMAL